MSIRFLTGDCRSLLATLPAGSVQCVVTSPPYFGLRDYGVTGQRGLEATPEEYVGAMVGVFEDVRRVLTSDGTVFLNLGDSYAGSWSGNSMRPAGGTQREGKPGFQPLDDRVPSRNGVVPAGLKPKDLIGIPWRVAFGLQAAGWWLRSEIIWAKPNGMPGSQEDRVTSSHEAIFMLSKSARYFSDFDAIKTPPREATTVRLSQDVQAQAGSHRANGGDKTNGPMKAMSGKQRGHSRRHAGFNDRWDMMEKAEQQSRPVMMRDVWFVSPGGYADAHFAVMPEEIARRCILAGSREGDTVLDPFGGAGTVGLMADRLNRDSIMIELSPAYVEMAQRRVLGDAPLLTTVSA